MKKIIFIISMPRAGSTLLQRTLATHPRIYSKISEPWLALRFFPAREGVQTVSDVGWRAMEASYAELVTDSCAAQQAYDQAVAGAMKGFYGQLMVHAGAQEADHYLDKTPRYLLILKQLIRAFPDEKFILIQRNPLAIAASAINTWSKRGEWNLFSMNVDFHAGFQEMGEVLAAKPPSVHVIKYEDFVSAPEEELGKIAKHLNIQAEFKLNELGGVNGTYGDPTGVHRYGSKISDASLEAWVPVFAPYWRRRWAIRHLNAIGRERLAMMGYDYEKIMMNLCSVPVTYSRMLEDPIRMAGGFLILKIKACCFSFIRRYE